MTNTNYSKVTVKLQMEYPHRTHSRKETRVSHDIDNERDVIACIIEDILPYNKWANVDVLMVALIMMTVSQLPDFQKEWYAPVLAKLWDVRREIEKQLE